MKPFLRMRKVLLYVLFLSFGSAKEPYAYLYLLPFDNIHLIDLDGALSQSLVNQTIIKKIISTVPIPVQLGGGIRNFKTIENLISVGVQRIILGTIALSDPQLVKKACKYFPNKIAIGIDAKNVR